MAKIRNLEEFKQLQEKTETEHPKWFALDVDCVPTVERIETIEKYCGIKFPNSYKEFLLQYGGGYFAFVVVYSMDKQSPFYMKANVSPEFIKEKKFLPVIDFETGDTAGFKIINGVCEEMVALYNHEEKTITDLNLNFYDTLAKYGLKV